MRDNTAIIPIFLNIKGFLLCFFVYPQAACG
jgi:hypothetical protein